MDLTQGNITGKLIKFALPLMLGNILQQCYNIADTLIVGRYVGNDALAAVGASYTLMIFLTSIILGLSMGAGAFISMEFGKKDYDRMKNGIVLAFVLIGSITLLITFVFFAEINNIIKFLQIPTEITKLTKQYLLIIGMGIIGTFFYNFFGNGLRAIGNSLMPLIFLGISAVQDFGNAVSTFVAQNYGAGKQSRIKEGWRQSMIAASIFCASVSAVVFIFAEKFMGLFVTNGDEIINVGAGYLRIEGTFYIGIGILFLLYGFYRAVQKPEMSLVLTIISLGTRVVLAYALSSIPQIGVIGIWVSVPIGWALADVTGLLYMRKMTKNKKLSKK